MRANMEHPNRYYTDRQTNYVLKVLQGVSDDIIVDDVTLRRHQILPCRRFLFQTSRLASPTTISFGPQTLHHVCARFAFHVYAWCSNSHLLYCHDNPILCRLFLDFNKPIVSTMSWYVDWFEASGDVKVINVQQLALWLQQYQLMCSNPRNFCSASSTHAQLHNLYATHQRATVCLFPITFF